MRLFISICLVFCLFSGFMFSRISLKKSNVLSDELITDTLFQELKSFNNSEFPAISCLITNPSESQLEIDEIVEIRDASQPASLFKPPTYQNKTILPNANLTLRFYSSYPEEHRVGKHHEIWKVTFKNSAHEQFLKFEYDVLNNRSLLQVTSSPPPIVKQGELMHYTAEITNPTDSAIVIKGLKILGHLNTEVNCETVFPITIPAGGKTELKLKYETEKLPDQYQLSISFETNEKQFRNWVTVPLNSAIIFVHGPRILFDTLVQYLEVNYGGNGNFEFWYTNTGNEPLIISHAKGSCGCLVPSWSREPINPGQRGVIHIKYDTHREGPINKTVSVTSNAIPSISLLHIRGLVQPRPPIIKEEN